MEEFILENWDKIIGLTLGFITILFPLYQFILTKSLEQKDKRFQNYHKLLDDLLNSPEPKIDRQMAIVYELRHFKEYYPVTLRILEGLKESWKEIGERHPRIVTEIELTERFIKSKSSNKGLK